MLALFGAGMLIAHLPADMRPGRRARRLLLGLAAVLVVADTACHQLGGGYLGQVIRDLPAAAGFALLIICARDAHPGGNLTRRSLTWIGTVSFGLYLWHVPVIWSLRAAHLLPLDPVAALPIVLAPRSRSQQAAGTSSSGPSCDMSAPAPIARVGQGHPAGSRLRVVRL